MNLGLSQKNALVTGSSKGIGKQCALQLAEEGANVAICARTESTLQETADEIERKTGGTVLPVQADLTEGSDIKRLVSQTRERFGSIDIVVANTGGAPVGEFEEFSDEDWEHAFNLDFLSNVRLARETVPEMANQGWGRMIFSTSIAVKQPLEGFLLSNSVRLGVEGLAKTLSNQYSDRGVTVNCALPGYTQTERLEDIPEEDYKEVTEEIPMGRFGEPQEFADVVTFLASEQASYVSGVSIQVDGGFIDSVF